MDQEGHGSPGMAEDAQTEAILLCGAAQHPLGTEPITGRCHSHDEAPGCVLKRLRLAQEGMGRLAWQGMHEQKPCFSVELGG